MIKKLQYILFLFVSFMSFSQEKNIKGQVVVNASLEGIKVENINTEIAVYTDALGYFEITAKHKEVLVFSSVGTERKVLILNEEHFGNLFKVELKTTTVEIEEVEIGGSIDMGFGGEKYTEAERKYKTSGQVLKMNQGFDFNLEAIGNLFNGKRKQLKKALEIEKSQKRFVELDDYFDEDFYLNSLGLEPDYVADFKYFLIDNKKFQKVLETKNENTILLEAVKMNEDYKKMKADEK